MPTPLRLLPKPWLNDDVPTLERALSDIGKQEETSYTEYLDLVVWKCIRYNACNVLDVALAEPHAKPPAYSHLSSEERPSKELLETLINHGWDINARRLGEQPLLWQVLHDGDLVRWCIDHGATATPQHPKNIESPTMNDQEQKKDRVGCPPILENAASRSTVSTFELLRSKGGELGPRTLHFAARAAINSGHDCISQEIHEGMPDKERAETFVERLAMVRHLLDTVGLDANLLDQPKGSMLGNHWGTPLCYVAKSSAKWDCSEVVKCLLQRGADPRMKMDPMGWDAMGLAKEAGNQRFVDVVEEWEANEGRSAEEKREWIQCHERP